MENKYGRFAFMPLSVKSSHLAIEEEMMINYDEGELYIRKNSTNILIASSKVSSHIYDTNNPHKVTKEQIGLGNVTNVTPVKQDDFIAHINDKDNPHGVTKEHIGLGNVKNYGIATTEDIVEGKSDKYLTPKVFLDYLDEYDIGIIDPGGGGDPGTGDPGDPKPPIKKEGTVSFIVTPSDAIVSVNVGGEWKRGLSITVPYGSYQYKIEKQGYITRENIVSVTQNNIVIREILQKKDPDIGQVSFFIFPEDATVQVQVNGSWVVSQSNIFNLEYGKYSYKLSLVGYVSFIGSILVNNKIHVISHTLEKIPDQGGGTPPDPTDPPPIIPDPPPEQIEDNEIYIKGYDRFSDVIIESMSGSSAGMRYIKNEGVLVDHKPDELYRITLIPKNMIYKIVFVYIDTNKISKILNIELEEEDMVNLSFKVPEGPPTDNILEYTVNIKSNISSVDSTSTRFIDESIRESVTNTVNIQLPSSLYDISVNIKLIDNTEIKLTSSRIEYLQDIDFLIIVNKYNLIKIENLDSVSENIGIFTSKPLATFTTMVTPKNIPGILNSNNYLYVPIDSIVNIIISEPGKIPRMKVYSDITDDTIIDINDI